VWVVIRAWDRHRHTEMSPEDWFEQFEREFRAYTDPA
jgi:hypothetical protein